MFCSWECNRRSIWRRTCPRENNDNWYLEVSRLFIRREWSVLHSVTVRSCWRVCRKQFGLWEFLPRSLVSAAETGAGSGRGSGRRRQTQTALLVRRLRRHIDDTLRARNKANMPLTSLQMKLHYLRIIAQLPSYGTRYFLVCRYTVTISVYMCTMAFFMACSFNIRFSVCVCW